MYDGTEGVRRLYFDTDDGQRASHDQQGIDLPSPGDVPCEAVEPLRGFVDIAMPLAPRAVAATVWDATGAVVVETTVPVTDEYLIR